MNLKNLWIQNLNTLQEQYVPIVQSGKNIALQAPTGSGKTLVYLLGILEKIDTSSPLLQAIILAPTQDLAMQIFGVAKQVFEGVKIATIGSGQSIKRQIDSLKKEKPQIIIGNVERVLALIEDKKIKVHGVQTLILDEIDSMASQKSFSQITTLRKKLMRDIQICTFSATYNEKTLDFLTSEWRLQREQFEQSLPKTLIHTYDVVSPIKQGEYVTNYLKKHKIPKTLIFVNKTGHVGDMVYELEKRGLYPASINKFIDGKTRKLIVGDFSSGNTPILITTDAFARGIDLPNVDLVIHAGLPFDLDSYIHRSGRTGRQWNMGTVLSVLKLKEQPIYKKWMKESEIKIKKAE